MASILGLLGTESLAAERFKSIRRQVFYFYPNGAAPLMGLLSMLSEESINDPEFKIFEERLPEQKTETEEATGVCFYAAGSGTTAGTIFSGDQTLVVGTSYCLRVASTEQLRQSHIIRLRNMPMNAGGTTTNNFRVVDDPFTDTNEYVRVTPLANIASINHDAFVTNEVLVVGNANRQGQVGASEGVYEIPNEFTNYLQIFRSNFTITGTALKTPVRYDDTGVYKDKAKKHSIKHMREMEFAFIFGQQSKQIESATNLPLYTTGGILWFMEQYEAANSTYRGGTGAAAITLDTDDDKRIIENSGNTLSIKQYNGYLERVFRVTNSTVNEKLVLCGSGFLSVINELYSNKAVLNADLPMDVTFGMDVVSHRTPFGTIHYKSHPLFSQNAILRYNALFLDVHNLVYNHMEGRDTELLTERQPNNADYREDEWFTEAGLESRFPESGMYLQNVLDTSI
jgi:hypothetical protein